MAALLSVNDLRQHVETDLVDAALQRLLDDADAAIVERHGPHAGNVTERLTGGHKHIYPSRRISAVVTVTEEDGTATTVLTGDDHRLAFGGHALERLPVTRAWSSVVEVVYTPVAQTARRIGATIDLVKLAVSFDGAMSVRAGDFSATSPNYEAERERILGSLDETVRIG